MKQEDRKMRLVLLLLLIGAVLLIMMPNAEGSWQALRGPHVEEDVLFRLASLAQAAQPPDPSRISPVVQVASFNGPTFLKAGSGTIIHPSGLILTNFHVISDAQGGCENVRGAPGTLFVILVTEEGKEDEPPVPKFTAVRLPEAEDPDHDLAILKLDQMVIGVKDLEELKKVVSQLPTVPLPDNLELPSLGLWDSSVLQEGWRLLAQGYPDIPEAGLPRLTISRGPVFTLEPGAQPKFLFIENIFTIPGISGGPVLEADSNLIVGVMCGSKVPQEKPAQEPLERAVLINLVQPLLEKAPQRVNRVPVAEFAWTPLNPKVGETVAFDATGSRDPDGSIVRYEWDFNGDGQPDQSGRRVTFTVPSEEDVSVTLIVTDNEGGSHSRSKRVILLRQATCVARIGERRFPSIQAAIDAALAGETISVSEGRCQENLQIKNKRNLTLQGAGSEKTVLFGTGEAPVIKIEDAQQITVEGFTIRDGRIGVEVLRSFQVTLHENAISKNLGRGIELVGAQGPSAEVIAVELVLDHADD